MSRRNTHEARFARLREELRLLYHGHSVKAVRFQRVVLLVDLSIILFFIAGPVLRDGENYIWIDIGVAVLLASDIVARSLASTDLFRLLRQPTTIVDLFVLVTLLLPIWLSNFGFLRILRLSSVVFPSAVPNALVRPQASDIRKPTYASALLWAPLFAKGVWRLYGTQCVRSQ